MLFFSVEGRPTQELVFTTEQEHTFAIGEEGEIIEPSNDDFTQMRWSLITVELCNEDTEEAIVMARQHATDNGWQLSDVFYYD